MINHNIRPLRSFVKAVGVFLFGVLFANSAFADKNPFEKTDPDAPKILDMGWSDRSYLDRQVATIDEIARKNLGTQVRVQLSDLDLLQRIINQRLIAQDDNQTQQALGAVLGNVMAADIPSLEWKVYEDELGRSRALCVKSTNECLFPITMLSRRMKVGLQPDVHKVYEDAIAELNAYLPQFPYGGGTLRKLVKP